MFIVLCLMLILVLNMCKDKSLISLKDTYRNSAIMQKCFFVINSSNSAIIHQLLTKNFHDTKKSERRPGCKTINMIHSVVDQLEYFQPQNMWIHATGLICSCTDITTSKNLMILWWTIGTHGLLYLFKSETSLCDISLNKQCSKSLPGK